ncbi:hypothetical protein HP499_22035, partial [Paenarthrobacter sp. CM16]|uniref:FG-GAP-like repeat-containing protein n=1 Tax=Paenarthrobacter sp. CM16 TaxID=2738447 RepID=UPI001552A915
MTAVLDRSRAWGTVNAPNRRRTAVGAVSLGLAMTVLLGTSASPATADAVDDVVPVGDRPASIAVNTSTDTAYVATWEGIFSVGGSGGGRIYLPSDYPSDVAVNSKTNKVYVSDANSVAVLDGVTNAATIVPVGAKAGVLAVNEKTNKVYVSTPAGLKIIDGATNTATPIPTSTGALDIAVNTSTNKVYALSGGTVKVIDASGKITSTVSVGADGIGAITINPSKNRIYFTTTPKYGSSVKVIDGASDTIVGSMASESPLGTLAVNPATDKVYVESDTWSSDGSVKVIDGTTLTETAHIATATRVRSIVVNPSNNKIYATQTGRGATVIDGRNNTSIALYTGQEPDAAVVNTSNNRVYVVNAESDSVGVIDGNAEQPLKNDFNKDRKADILARDTAGVLWLYPGDGSGGWLPRVQVGQGWNVMSALVSPGDFNGDGNADVLARDGGGVLWLYPGNGSGGWLARVQVGSGWEGMSA